MTDEQLLEQYSKELFGNLYDPLEKMTVARLIDSHRRLREKNIEWNGAYGQAQKEGYKFGYDWGVKNAAENTIQFKDLREMTIQDLANLIGTDDD